MSVVPCLGTGGRGRLEQVLQGTLDEASHGKRFPTASLPVSKHSAVITLQDSLDDDRTHIFVDRFRSGGRSECGVELYVFSSTAGGTFQAAGFR